MNPGWDDKVVRTLVHDCTIDDILVEITLNKSWLNLSISLIIFLVIDIEVIWFVQSLLFNLALAATYSILLYSISILDFKNYVIKPIG